MFDQKYICTVFSILKDVLCKRKKNLFRPWWYWGWLLGAHSCLRRAHIWLVVTGNTHFSFVVITRFMGALSAKIWWWGAQIHFNGRRPSPSPSPSPPGDIECKNHDHEPDQEQHPGQCAAHDVDLGGQVQLHNFFFFCKLHRQIQNKSGRTISLRWANKLWLNVLSPVPALKD